MLSNNDEIDVFGDKKTPINITSELDKLNKSIHITKETDRRENVTKELLKSLLNKNKKIQKEEKPKNIYSINEGEDVKSHYSHKPEIIILDHPKVNINVENVSNTIYMNEYWNSEDDIIPTLECISLWRRLKTGEKGYFFHSNDIEWDKIEIIKEIFKKSGFKCIKIAENKNNIENTHIIKIEFEKLSISKIRNWEYLRQIHILMNED